MSNSETPEPGTERTLRSGVRNPRRRQRQNDNDSLKAAAPRRKRSKLSEDTFQPRETTESDTADPTLTNGHDTMMNGNAHGGTNGHHRSVSETPAPSLSIPLRGRHASVKRHAKHISGQTLASDDFFAVKELVSTPRELKKNGLEYRGSLGGSNHALAITHEKAIIWDYTANIASSNPRTFELPFGVKQNDPLPHGALVSHATRSSEMGLVLISATTGDATYYDSIDRAASMSLFNDNKPGVEGSIGKLFSGETIVDLIPAEHAGFVVVLSSGRLAQITLTDGQGKARISSSFLKITDSNPGGIFGSLRGYLGSTYRKDVVAVHTRPLSTRGQTQALALTQSSELLIWDLDWSGRSDYKSSLDLKTMFVTELKSLDVPEITHSADAVVALDFAILDQTRHSTGRELATVGAEQPLKICVLLKVGRSDMFDYVLIDLELAGDKIGPSRIDVLKSYHGTRNTSSASQPRLHIPEPGHTAYISLDDLTTFLFARQEVAEPGPEAQLHASYVQLDPVEEAVRLRADKCVALQSLSAESVKGDQASCVAFVKSYGLIRISTSDLSSPRSIKTSSVKSKIEQAVFHGILQPDNIIDFSRKDSSHYQVDEVDRAALEISDEILRASTSFTEFISPNPQSLEQHLAKKAQALQALLTHVRHNYPVISKSTMWRLLWDAERVAAGQQLWLTFETHIQNSGKSKRKATLMDELCSWFSEDTFAKRKDLADQDEVRKFFIGGLHRIEKLLLNTRVIIEALDEETQRSPEQILNLVVQGNDLWLKALDTAYAFRSEHAASYGISSELIPDGLLLRAGDYAEIPEFWTSTVPLVQATAFVATMSRDLSNKFFENEALQPILEPLVREIATDNPRLIELYCVQCQEAIRWKSSRPSEKDQELAREMHAAFEISRYEQLRSLAAVGQAEAGMRLAEKYFDMPTLVDMILAEDQYLDEAEAEATAQVKDEIQQTRVLLEQKVARLFKVYGTDWANPFFDKAFSSDQPGFSFIRAQLLWTEALGVYLRAHPGRAKLCWINDVTDSNDYTHASAALADAAKNQENQIWAKKVELSMSKLALLAAEEEKGDDKQQIAELAKEDLMHAELVVVDAQDAIYRHIHKDIAGALDRQAVSLLLIGKYGRHVEKMSALRHLLMNGLDLIVDHTVLSTEEIIDVLTLMTSVDNDDLEEDDNLNGAEFALALNVLNAEAASLPPQQFETLLQLIWKRCYVYDDWIGLRLSRKQTDQDRREALHDTAAWRTLFHARNLGLLQSPSDSTPEITDDKDTTTIIKTNGTSTTHDRPKIRFVTPSACLGAACEAEDLASRFPDPDLLQPILRDNRLHDEQLQKLIQDKSLDELVAECAIDAERAWRERENEEAALRQAEAEFEDGFVEEVENLVDEEGLMGYEVNGHAEVPNGFKAREFERGFDLEEGEDVEMSD